MSYKITKEELKEAVDTVFKENPLPKNNLYVYANKKENKLSFKLTSSRILYTGIKGFLNYISIEYNKKFDNIFINNFKLDDELTIEFWKWIENIKNNL